MVTPISSVNAIRPMSLITPDQSTLLAERLSSTELNKKSGATTPSGEHKEVQEKFQEFMAGTFYGQMVKALRAGQEKPAYFHGGQAEEIFESQMDQIVATKLAKSHGAEFAEPLFRAYLQQRGENPAPTSQLDVTA